MNQSYYAIIMAGGIGSRFWPMSRAQFPKQFHDILGNGTTLIQDTFNRFASFIPPENIYIVTNTRYYALVKQQLPQISDHQILLEPVGRNTAPCVAYSCYKIQSQDPNAVFVVAPSDHIIKDEATFARNIQLGLQTAQSGGSIVTLGITPTRPDTGYGYIQYLPDQQNKGYYRVKTFTEKPNLEVAKLFLKSGDYVWNSGIFIFSARTILTAFESLLPEISELFISVKEHYYQDSEQEEINRIYPLCRNISMDFGIMEKAEEVHVIPSEFGWSDLGTWTSVYEHSDKDANNNALQGNILAYRSSGSIVKVKDKKKLVVIDGVEDAIVIDTGDCLLICKKENEQLIKQTVNDVKKHFGEPYA